MLTRQRAGVARSQTSTRAGVHAYAQTPDSPQGLRPSSRASTVVTYGNLRPSSRLSDAGSSAYLEMGQDPDAQGDPLSGMDVIVPRGNAGLSIDEAEDAIERPASAKERPASAMTGMQPYWARPTSALSCAPPNISVPTSSVAHSRPAGVSRTSGVKRDLISIKRDLISIKRDLISIKRDLISIKRDLISIKRDLISIKRDLRHRWETLRPQLSQCEKKPN